MARDRANIRTDMLADDDFRSLSMPAQHLYLMLLIHPTLNYAGVADWRAGRLAAMTAGVTREVIEVAAGELASKHFVHVDEDTEEVLIRSFVRHDGLLKQYRLPVSMAKDYAGIASPDIRMFFAHELKRLNDEMPDEKCWDDERVQKILSAPSKDMKELTYAEGYGDGYAEVYAIGYGDDFAESSGVATRSATTTATTTATEGSKEPSPEDEAKRETKLPKNWAPTASHIKTAKEKNIDVLDEAENFRLHAETHDRRAVSWNSAFATWLKKSNPKVSSIRSDHHDPANW